MNKGSGEHDFDASIMLPGIPKSFSKKSHNARDTLETTDLATRFIQSSGSSAESSLDDFDFKRYARSSSFDSSRSGAATTEEEPYIDKGLIGRMPVPGATSIDAPSPRSRSNSDHFLPADLDSSNRAMELDFDFDEAASSPSPRMNSIGFVNSRLPRSNMMPLRSRNNTSTITRLNPYSGRSKESIVHEPLTDICRL